MSNSRTKLNVSSVLSREIQRRIKTPETKRSFNQLHFTESAPRYDIATRALSLFQDAYWKRKLVEFLPMLDEAPVCLDIACGTGDVTFLLAKKFPKGEIYGVDLTESMLEVARKRNEHKNISFIQQDMCKLDFDSESIDIITASYAIRNAPDLSDVIFRMHKVLKPGGVVAILDFSKPSNKSLQKIQYWLLKLWGSFWGLVFHGNAEVHGYISASLLGYPDRNNLHASFERVGLNVIDKKQYLYGMMEILVLRKES